MLEKIDCVEFNDDERSAIDLSPLSFTDEEMEKYIRKAFDNGNIAMFVLLNRNTKRELNEELFAKACDSGNVPFVAILKKKVSDKARIEAFRNACEAGNIPLIEILNPAKKKYNADDEDDKEDEM